VGSHQGEKIFPVTRRDPGRAGRDVPYNLHKINEKIIRKR
jgi:hypothetical protein